MKVLRLIGGVDPGFGGPSVSSINAIIAAQRAGADTVAAFPVDPDRPHMADAAISRLTSEAVAVETFPLARRPAARAHRWGISHALRRWLRSHRREYDIVHCHGAWVMPTREMLRYAGRRREPLIVLSPYESLTDFDIAKSPNRRTAWLKRRLRKRYLAEFDLIVLASRLEARDSVPPAMAQSEHVAVVYHAVYDDRRQAARPRVAAVAADGLRVGFIGRHDEIKNLDLVIRALPRLNPRVALIVAGEGPQTAALHRLAHEIGVAERITWLGFVSGAEKASFFRHIDLLAMPSAYECFGMAAGEALAAGVPALVTRETGIGEIIEAGGGGEIIRPEVGAIADAIEKLLHNPKQLAQYSQHAATAAQASLSFSAHGAAIRRHYERLLTDYGDGT